MKKAHHEPLPKAGIPGVLRYVQRALAQTGIQEVIISARGIEVTRELPEDFEEVVPAGSNEVDAEFLLSKVELVAYPFLPDDHGTLVLFMASQVLGAAGGEARWLLVPGLRVLLAWLGLPEDCPAPKYVYGLQLIIVSPEEVNGRAVLLGAPSGRSFLSDATHGIAMDLGV